MDIVKQELKKLLHPVRLLMVLALLCGFCAAILGSQKKALACADTASFPQQITASNESYSLCSADMQFHDYLFEHYGTTITEEDLPALATEREALKDQIIRAAAEDPILQRNRVKFHHEFEQFIEYRNWIYDEDQAYVRSCVNGEAQLQGTEHPVGFLSKYRTVMERVTANGSYHVMSSSLLELLGNNFLIVIVFSCGALLLIVPYGVIEAKSRTESVTASTKLGKALYFRKITAAGITAASLIVVGMIYAALSFSAWKVSRYYGCEIGDAMELNWKLSDYNGMSFCAFYLLHMLCLFLLGLSVNVLAVMRALRTANSATAVACTLPLALLLLVFHFAYDPSSKTERLRYFGIRWEPYGVVSVLALITTIIAVTEIIYRREVRNSQKKRIKPKTSKYNMNNELEG